MTRSRRVRPDPARAFASVLTPAVACAFAVVVAVASPLHAQDRPLVVIDPGHGGDANQVVLGDIQEKDLMLRVGFAMGATFVEAGYDVHFTRTRDHDVPWDERRSQAEEAGAVALIMLHAMSSEDPSDSGAEIYFDPSNGPSTAFSNAAAEQLRALGSEVLVDPRPDWPFLQSPSVPTTMIELAHLSNPTDRENMLDPAYHRRLGEAMVAAVGAIR